MTGDALHTKYRPTSLDEVVGQEHVKDGLARVLSEGRQQAFLFQGPSGTGKTTLARLAAAELNCTAVDEIDAASHTGVDAMRAVADRANYTSLDGGNRAIIVDETHRLSRQAWDSLLKIIEEPPTGVYWFFCTTEGAKVPETVQTRCVCYSLKEVPYRPLLRLIASVAEKESLDLVEDVLDVAVMEARGSPRQALVNLTAVKHTTSRAEAEGALSRASSAKEAVDLARLIIKPDFSFAKVCKVLTQLSDTPPESIRQQVRAYATQVILNAPDNRWARGVLMAFESPSYDYNHISDILCRVITLEKWKRRC